MNGSRYNFPIIPPLIMEFLLIKAFRNMNMFGSVLVACWEITSLVSGRFFYKFNISSAEGCGITGPSFTSDAVFVVIYCDKVEYVEKL